MERSFLIVALFFFQSIFGALNITFGAPSKIIIPYRGDRDGKGAFYDHWTLQRTCNIETVASYPDEKAQQTFQSYIANFPGMLPYGIKDQYERVYPETYDPQSMEGLLVIPGYAHASEGKNISELKHQRDLIHMALLRGQPILAICAGCWTLATHPDLKGIVSQVTGHAYSTMMRLDDRSLKVGHNKKIHDVVVTPGTFLHAMVNSGSKGTPIVSRFPVNSVHWLAVSTVPNSGTISAWASDGGLNPQNRQGPMYPEQSVEAFELNGNALVLGLQWHPEASLNENTNDAVINKKILRYMALAGEQYARKRRMLQQLETIFNSRMPSPLIRTIPSNAILPVLQPLTQKLEQTIKLQPAKQNTVAFKVHGNSPLLQRYPDVLGILQKQLPNGGRQRWNEFQYRLRQTTFPSDVSLRSQLYKALKIELIET